MPSVDLIKADFRRLLHFTRNWLHYGWMLLAIFCILTAAVERLLGY